MFRLPRLPLTAAAAVSAMLLSLTGCGTSLKQYVGNGFKVGPNYRRPPAAVAEHWIDAGDPRVRTEAEDLNRWWTVFNDPMLNRLIADAYGQNLSLREAGFRVLQARAGLGIARGELFPQLQDAFGSYRREGLSPSFFDQWSFGFSLAWELDFWGRFRRAVQAADDQLDASVEDYDYVLVTLLADVAANYVQIRTDQERIRLLEENAEVERGIVDVAQRRFDAGAVDSSDPDQAKSNLRQTEAAIEELRIDLRLANNRLCILLGIPPENLVLARPEGRAQPTIPTIEPAKAIGVGIPADLVRRRPDVRLAERLAAAQAEQIGIAESELYPAFTINGTLGYQARNFGDLFSSKALSSSVGPSFQWNLLNYGRIVNSVRLEDARFRELVVAYQNTVLQANAEVENGLVTFLRAERRAGLLAESVQFAQRALKAIMERYGAGTEDFNRVAVVEQSLIQQQDLWAQARGDIAQGLIAVYRALGGGWEIRLGPQGPVPAAGQMPPPGGPGTPEQLPIPPRAPEPPQGPPMAR